MWRSLWAVSLSGASDPPVFLNSCYTGFTEVESLSDLIDGDPPESMRLEKQDSPSLWQTKKSIHEGRQNEGLCVMITSEPGALE